MLHQIGVVEHLDRIKGMEFAKDRMRTEEVVISNPRETESSAESRNLKPQVLRKTF